MNRKPEQYTGQVSVVGAIAALAAFAALWRVEALQDGRPIAFDRDVLLFLHDRASAAWDALTWVMAFLGSLWVVLGVAACAAAVAFSRKRAGSRPTEKSVVLRRAGRVMPVACVGGTLIVEVAKAAAHRPRPHLFTPLFRATGYSFPSGHAFLGLTVFSLVAYFAYGEAVRRNAPPFARVLLLVGTGLLIFSIGVSRVYAGVHYPTDVLAGWAGATAWVLICLRIFRAPK